MFDEFSLAINSSNKSTSQDVIVHDFTINVGNNVLFQNTNFDISYRQKIGIIGRNGVGKTTLMKYISERKFPIHPSMDMFYVEQEIESTDNTPVEVLLYCDKDRKILHEKLSEYYKVIECTDDRVLKEYVELENEWHQRGYDGFEAKARKLLYGLGFQQHEQDQPVSSFSGGWRMRIAIAQALFLEPTLLMLDEPTNHLDLNAVIWLTDYLSTYPKSLLVISHDKYFLNEICTHTIFIYQKQCMKYTGNYDQCKKLFNMYYEKQANEWKKYDDKIKFMKRKNVPKKEIDAYTKKNMVIRPEKMYTVDIHFSNVMFMYDVLIDVQNVTFMYDNTLLFENVNFTLNMNCRIALVGPNGIGKSTLLRILVGELIPTSGKVVKPSRVNIGYYSQHFAETLPLTKTCIEYLLGFENNVELIRKLLGTIGLSGEHHKKKIKELSGGQKARVAFISLFLMSSHLIVLDEPSNHLDMETLDALINAINDYNGGIIIVTHNADLITRTRCDLYTVKNNTILRYNKDYNHYKNYVLTQK